MKRQRSRAGTGRRPERLDPTEERFEPSPYDVWCESRPNPEPAASRVGSAITTRSQGLKPDLHPDGEELRQRTPQAEPRFSTVAGTVADAVTLASATDDVQARRALESALGRRPS